jgi:hypothetical protein
VLDKHRTRRGVRDLKLLGRGFEAPYSIYVTPGKSQPNQKYFFKLGGQKIMNNVVYLTKTLL